MIKKLTGRGGPREGSGRPKTLMDIVTIGVTMSRAERDKLDKWRAKRSLNRSQAVRVMIERLR